MSFSHDDAFIVGPFARASRAGASGSVRWLGDGTLIATPGAVSGSASIGGAWRRRVRGATLELDGEGSALAGSGAQPGRSVLAGARLERTIGAAAGVWLRGSGHRAWREAGLLEGHGMGGGAWWMPKPHATLTGQLARTRAEGQLFADDGRDRVLGIVPVRFTEGSVAVALRPAWGDLRAGVGARHDRDAERQVEPLWHVTSTIRTRGRASLVLAAVHDAPDFVRGADGATSFSVGMRWSTPTAGAHRTTRRLQPGQATVRVDSAGQLRVSAPGASVVEVMGTFTDWAPVELAPSGGDFHLQRPIPSGSHRLAVRVDGGPWVAPANTPTIDDEFGGRVGLLVVPEGP